MCQAGAFGRAPWLRRALVVLATAGLWAAAPGSARAEPRPAAGTAAEAVRYVMRVTVDPLTDGLRVSADVTLRCSAASGSVELALNRGLKISTVRDAEGHALRATRSGVQNSERFAVELGKPCAAGGEIELRFEYAGTVHPRPPFAATPDFLLLRDDDAWYPQAGVFDFAANDVTVRVPAGFEARTSGELAEQRPEGTTMVFHWKTAGPVDGCTLAVYLRPGRPPVTLDVALPAGPGAPASATRPFHITEICGGPVTDQPRAAPCGELARRAAEILRWYAQMLGPPAVGSLAILPAPSPSSSGIGYSAPGMLVVNDWAQQFSGDADAAPQFLPHEIAHQWFPNGVAPASASDGWLAESLAEYLAWRYLLAERPEAARVMVAEAMRDAVAYTPMRPLSLGLELLAGPWSAARATLYQRGMLVFRTLETVIDRERVDRVLPEFYKRYAGRKASIADFRGVCEGIAGRNLGWFFEYFIEGTQIPTIDLRRVESESPEVAAGEIVVQDFPAEGSVRVEMKVRTAKGRVDHSVATRGAVTPFTVNVPAPALGITLDPDLRILRWTPAAERSREQTAILSALPEVITPENLTAAIAIYRQALAADPEDASQRTQSLRERLGELESAKGETSAALSDLEAAINGHSIGPYETYLWRAKAYVYHGIAELHEGRAKEALADAQAAMALPRYVLLQSAPERAVESHGQRTLGELLETLTNAATRH